MERRKILIIILVLAVVPVLVFSAAFVSGGLFAVSSSASCPEKTSGLAAEDLRVEDFGVGKEGSLHLELRNSAPETVVVESIRLNDTVGSFDNRTLDVAETGVFSVQGFRESETCQNFSLNVNYSTGGIPGKSQGSLQGRIEAVQK